MKLFIILLTLTTLSPVNALEIGGINLEKGIYTGQKMGINIGSNDCQVKIIEVFEDKGVVIEFEGRVEYLALTKENDALKSLNRGSSPFDFTSSGPVPKLEIFEYTDGPALRSISKTWDCTMLKKR